MNEEAADVWLERMSDLGVLRGRARIQTQESWHLTSTF